MLSNSLNRLNRTNRLITVEDISDNLLSGRSAAHTACWKYLQTNSNDSALEYADEIIRKEPDSPDGYVFKARALYQKKRFLDAEQVLLQVMHIAEDNDMIRSDVEGMVKLKDELANSRVEILKARNFRDPLSIADMHWSDTKKAILELIGFAPQARGGLTPQSRAGGGDQKRDESAPMEVDPQIIDIIGPERAKQLYPQLFGGTSKAPNGSTYSQRRSDNLHLSGSFPIRKTKSSSDGTKTALALAEERNDEYEKTINGLEAELKRVYESFKKLNDEKKTLEKKCNTLTNQLDRALNGSSKRTNYQREDDNEIEVIKTVKKPTAYDYIRKQKRRALVFTNSKYWTNTRRIADRLRASQTLNKNNGGQNTTGYGTIRTTKSDQPKKLTKPMPGLFKSKPYTAYKSGFMAGSPVKYQGSDERLIRDLTYSVPRLRGDRNISTSIVEPSIVDNRSMAGTSRRYTPGILPMPSYMGTNDIFGTSQNYINSQNYNTPQNYDTYSSRLNRSAYY